MTHMKKRCGLYGYLALGFCCLVLGACAIAGNQSVLHNPPLGKGLTMIEKGRTTRDDVLKLFGTPDVEADGPRIKIGPNHPRMNSSPEAKFAMPRPGSQPPKPREVVVTYSSIDDDRVALLYLETLSTGLLVVPGGGSVSYAVNKLLIFVNKKTGIVEDFVYRGEFKTD